MLENAKEDVLCKLSTARGYDISVLDMMRLQTGSLIQVTTASGSVYLLEIIRERSKWVHFARYSQKNSHKSCNYFGKQKIRSATILVGGTLTHDNLTTKLITKITLLVE